MSRLRIAQGFALPVDVAGEAIAILAKRGAGKTNTARVLVEELHGAGVQVVVLDPVGAWWGLRSSADGKTAGLPLPVLGGAHGDVPLQATAGALLADVVVDTAQSIVLDLSDFSKTEQRRFVTDFAERLYTRKARDRGLLHLVLEEADEFAPQRVNAGDARMVGAIEQVVRRGRSRGIGLTMITQRSASLNKSILTQADVLFAMRTTGPQDRKAIETWVEKQDVDGADDVVPSLSSLATGEAWIWNPERELLARHQIRLAHTYDSSSTPKAGERRVEPRELAPIDLTALGDEIEATAERAKENDPGELRKKLRAVEDANRGLAAEIERLHRELPTGGDARIAELEAELARVSAIADELDQELGAALEFYASAHLKFAGWLMDKLHALYEEAGVEMSRVQTEAREHVGQIIAGDAPARAKTSERRAVPRSVPAPAARPPARTTPAPAGDPPPELGSLPLAATKMLTVLGQFPEGRTGRQLGVLSGYKVGGSSYRAGLADLRKRGYASPAGVDPIVATPEGLAVAPSDPLPTGRDLYEYWLGELPKGARIVLELLYDAWPNGYGAQELAEAAGYEPGGSSYRAAIAALRNLDLATGAGVDPIRASDELMETTELAA